MDDKTYHVVGLMSGTSLDGLDIAHCSFTKTSKWQYAINEAATVTYPEELKQSLKNSMHLSGLEIAQLNVDLGIFMGNAVNNFLMDIRVKVDFISSHGHTVFHQPHKSLTLQIGSPAHISAITGYPVVADFRTKDVALGGNGAPLVPIGDELLFEDYDSCLNLGGIANISFNNNGTRRAFDVCPFNIVFNHLANQLGMEYDKDGKISAGGAINGTLIRQLNELSYYVQEGPKSLGWEWVESEVIKLIDQLPDTTENKLRTFCAHVVGQISQVIPASAKKILVTGGGTWHSFFISELKKQTTAEVIVADRRIVDFKEALIFAFLGTLRWRNEVNCLRSVTGASVDNVGGAIYL